MSERADSPRVRPGPGRRHRRHRLPALLTALAALALPVVTAVPGVRADPVAPHGSVVPPRPATGYPVILGTPTYVASPNENCTNCIRNREVLAAHQAGSFIVAGGNFFEVRLQDGTVLQQKYLAAWNIDTKQLACRGQYVVNGIVRAVEPGGRAGTVYIGGDFTEVSGADRKVRPRVKVALLDLTTCSVVPTFVSTGADSRVSELELVGNRLFVGGDFTTIGGQPVRYVAELDAATGAARPGFSLRFGDSSLSSKIRGMGATPDGRRLIIGGRFGSVGDGVRTLTTQTAVVDISNTARPLLTAHSFTQTHPEYGSRPLGQSLQDVSVSPDGTMIGLAYGTATVSDYTYLVDAADRAQPVRWRKYLRDTGSGVAVSNNAFYVAGHFCKIDTGPGSTEVMSPRMGLNECTGSGMSGGAWRSHVAALSLTDGTPLAWNPGADSGFGGRELTVTSRGLLMGFDGQRVDDVTTGALAFLDLGAPVVADTTRPGDVVFSAPVPGSSVPNPVRISGSATDDRGVASFRIRIWAADGRSVQPNGTLGTTVHEFRPTASAGRFTIDVSMPPGTYAVEAKAVDTAGLASPNWVRVNVTRSGA